MSGFWSGWCAFELSGSVFRYIVGAFGELMGIFESIVVIFED